jgi:hypothetical protein
VKKGVLSLGCDLDMEMGQKPFWGCVSDIWDVAQRYPNISELEIRAQTVLCFPPRLEDNVMLYLPHRMASTLRQGRHLSISYHTSIRKSDDVLLSSAEVEALHDVLLSGCKSLLSFKLGAKKGVFALTAPQHEVLEIFQFPTVLPAQVKPHLQKSAGLQTVGTLHFKHIPPKRYIPTAKAPSSSSESEEPFRISWHGRG